MNDILDAMFANALLTIPFAILVALVARWLRRPAAVHVLWMIVLLKLVSPSLYDVPVPGLVEVTAHFAAPVSRATSDFGFKVKSANAGRVLSTKNNVQASSTGMNRYKANSNASRVSSEAPDSTPHASTIGPELKPGQMIVAARSISLRGILIFLWGLGTVTFFLLLGYRATRFHRFVQRAPLADSAIQSATRSIVIRYGLRATPKIRVASGDFPPLLWVLPGSASIVLPQQLVSELGPDAIRNLLAHELAHFARGDHWVRLLESVVLGICWWHPLAWWARRQLQHAEELCCDAWVIWAYPKSRTEYARTLLATLDYLSGAHAALPPLASGLGRANLIRRRFEMILHCKSPRKLSAFWIAATAMVAFTILPWSTSVFAQPQDIAVVAETDLDSEEGGSSSDLAPIASRLERQKQRKQKAQKRQTKQKMEQYGKHSHASDLDVSIDHAIESADLQRLIQATVHRALKEAQVGLKYAKSHLEEDVHVEVSRSLDELAKSDWLYSMAGKMTDTMNAFEGVSEEETEAIARHFETAMTHFGVAVEKSAQAFAKVMNSELHAIEEHFEEAEQEGHQHGSDLRASAMKALKAAGLSKKELQQVVEALDEQVGPKSTAVISEAVKQEEGPRRSKVQHRDEQVETILRKIKSLVKQLNEKVETDTDATSTSR